MSLAAITPRLFVPPYPRRPSRPRGSLSILLALQRNPIEVWSEGDFERPVSIGRTIFGLRAAAHDPAAVRRVFLDNAANYRKDDLQLRILRPGLGNGLLTAEGEDWRFQRRALAPLFSPRQIAEFAPAVHRVGQAAIARMNRRRDGAVADVAAVMSRLTLEVLEQTLFSQGLGREPSAFQRAVASYFQTIGRIDPLDLLGAPDFVPRLRRRRGRGALQFFDSAVDAIIEKRRALVTQGGEAPRDLLTLLMSARDPENGQGIAEADVRANIVTFINAGHETTANALTWTLFLLSQSPEWRERAEADASQAFDGQGAVATEKCEILRAVFEEALRLYPPAAMLARQAIGDDKLGDVRIPAGTVVTISPYVLHRRRGLWDHPDAFDPSRFLGEQRDRIDRFAYIPFGAGPRVCIGMAFAIQEGIVLLAHLLRAFRFDLVEGHPVMPLQRVTLRPREGMKMHVKRRDGR
ncbi:MAG TPA: cytochrome P450 [Roseiarcus sp.]|nr:cytochrome P450 [Roseiarcus sp.]